MNTNKFSLSVYYVQGLVCAYIKVPGFRLLVTYMEKIQWITTGKNPGEGLQVLSSLFKPNFLSKIYSYLKRSAWGPHLRLSLQIDWEFGIDGYI